MKKLLLLLVFCFCCSISSLWSAHILSGTMGYECLGNGNYEFTMIIYRDCLGQGADFDAPANIAIYTEDGTFVQDLTVNFDTREMIDPSPSEDCVDALPFVCVEKATYIFNANLPVIAETYAVVYQRCCWSLAVSNIDNPGERGITIKTELNPLAQAECNNNPVIEFPLSFAACPGEMTSIPLDGFDIDGDSLSYELCLPLEGGGPVGTPDNAGDPSACDGVMPIPPCAPPYEQLPFAEGFDLDNPFPTENGIAFNPVTGALEFTPTTVGRFVFGLCVTEYRDGEVIGNYFQNFMASSINEVVNVEEVEETTAWTTHYQAAAQEIRLQRNAIWNQATTIRLYQTNGQLLASQSLQATTEVTLNTAGLTPGIYLLQIEENNQQQVVKIMVY